MPTSNPGEGWRALHPTMLLFELLNVLRSYLFPLVITAVVAGGRERNDGSNSLFFLIPAITLPVLIALARYLSYRYKLAEGHVTIREGIVSRKVRSIPVKRIHNINTRQNLLARILTVEQLEIETAGGGGSEASLVALSAKAASEVRDYVRTEKAADDPLDTRESPGPEPLTLIHRVSAKDLLQAGATTSSIGVIFVGFFVVLETLNLEPDQIADWVKETSTQTVLPDEGSLFLLGILTFVLLLLISWIISIARAFLVWHGFSLSRRSNDLEIRTGLLTIREYTLPLDKIQALQCETSALRRLFGLCRIKVCSAGHVGLQKQAKGSDLLVPLTGLDRIGFFAAAVWPNVDWDSVAWQGVPPYTRMRHFRFLSLSLVTVLSALHFLVAGRFFALEPIVVYLVFGLVFSWVIAHFTWRQTAFAFNSDFAYIKTGFLGLHHWVIPVLRIQNARLSQTPFQRRRGLASLTLDVAGSSGGPSATIPNIDLGFAWLLFNRFTHSRVQSPIPGTGNPP